MKTLRRLFLSAALTLAAPLFGQQIVGNLTVQQYIRNADGTAAAPSFRFTTDPNTGFYSYGADQIGIAANGLAQGYFGVGGLTLLDSGDGITFHGSAAITGASGVLTFTGTLVPNATGNAFGSTALRWGSSYFSGPIYVGAASGTSPTITATGSSPTEIITFTTPTDGAGASVARFTSSALYSTLNTANTSNTSAIVSLTSSGTTGQIVFTGSTGIGAPYGIRQMTFENGDAAGFAWVAGGAVVSTLTAGALTGGPSNLTITSGTGNSRTLALRTTTSGGTATTALSIDDGQKVAIRSTSPISGVRTATATLNFASILAAAFEDLTITVTGAAVNDVVDLGLPAVVGAGAIFNAWVSASDTVTVRCNNAGSIAVDPASATYRVSAMSF